LAFAATVAAGLLLIPVVGLAQSAPAAGEQREPPEATGTPPAAEPVEHANVEGFRSARWGADAAQVKAAIYKDFGIVAEKVKTEENAAERTTVLSVTVNDLLEGAGAARVSYVLGFKTKKLIQVTILWGTPGDPQAPPDKIVTAANQLRQLFLDSGYQPETVVTNTRMADGTILVFQGQDADKHTTVLRLASAPAPVPAKGSKTGGTGSVVLSLSYSGQSEPGYLSVEKGSILIDHPTNVVGHCPDRSVRKVGAAAQHRQPTDSRPSIGGRFGGIEHWTPTARAGGELGRQRPPSLRSACWF
jgi:hypothetical protein